MGLFINYFRFSVYLILSLFQDNTFSTKKYNLMKYDKCGLESALKQQKGATITLIIILFNYNNIQ